MDIKIRPALETEINTLLEFESGIVKAERPFNSTLKAGEIHYYDLLELIASPDAEVLVVVVDGELVGSGYAKIKAAKPYIAHTHFSYLGFMYVRPEYRGQGINKMVLNALIDWSKSRGLTEVRLDVYDENLIAKKAYLKAGFKPHMLEMKMEI